MAIEWLEPGLASMVQGIPYRGHRHIGMPLAGAADPVSHALANWLAGNSAEVPAIETAYAPLAFVARQNMTIGIAGAAREIRINDNQNPAHNSIELKSGDRLKLAAAQQGCRSYLAVHGGFEADALLDGNSTYAPAKAGGSANMPLGRGALLKGAVGRPRTTEPRILPPEFQLWFGDQFILRIVDAPESHLIEGSPEHSYTVSLRADRIGMELEGQAVSLKASPPTKSGAVFPGTIQCPPSGKPFLLGPDAQTTGGYPRIAQVIRADRHLIGQLRPGARVRLQSVEPEKARGLYRSKLKLLRKLQPQMRLD